MKKKSEIKTMLKNYTEELEKAKNSIAEIAMDLDLEIEDKNGKLLKIQPVYQSYVSVVSVLEDILEVGIDDKADEVEEDV